jgi:hypothetical protein
VSREGGREGGRGREFKREFKREIEGKAVFVCWSRVEWRGGGESEKSDTERARIQPRDEIHQMSDNSHQITENTSNTRPFLNHSLQREAIGAIFVGPARIQTVMSDCSHTTYIHSLTQYIHLPTIISRKKKKKKKKKNN